VILGNASPIPASATPPEATPIVQPAATQTSPPLNLQCTARKQNHDYVKICGDTAPGAFMIVSVAYCDGHIDLNPALAPKSADGNGHFQRQWSAQPAPKKRSVSELSPNQVKATVSAAHNSPHFRQVKVVTLHYVPFPNSAVGVNTPSPFMTNNTPA
jgi:hypothetical protein